MPSDKGSSHKDVSSHSNDPLITKISDIKPSAIGPKPGKNVVDNSPEYEQNKFNRDLATKEFSGLPPKGAKG